MQRFKRLLSAITAAAVLATTSSISVFADVAAADNNEDLKFGTLEYQCIDQEGNVLIPELIPETIPVNRGSADASLSYFNLAEKGRVTSVKNQNPFGSCWAHAGCAAAESSMISQGYANTSVDYSEQHMAWFANAVGPSDVNDPMYGDCGLDYGVGAYDNGGTLFDIMGVLTRWSGVQLEANAPYEDAKALKTLPESQRYVSYAHAENIERYDPKDLQSIKNALVNTGACHIAYYHDDYYFNSSTNAYYTNYESSNHAVTLVGWDDNYSRTNFNSSCRPSSDGAWIIKNSWGPSWGDDGYFYLSYEDASINSIASIQMAPINNYSGIYQYDGSIGTTPAPSGGVYIYYYSWDVATSIGNIYTADSADPLAAVGFYTFDADTPYKVSIYRGVSSTTDPTAGTLVHSQTGTATYAGYHTIDLTKDVALTKGQKFSVVISFTDANKATIARDFNGNKDGISFIKLGTNSWYDANQELGNSMCIKAYKKTRAPQNVKVTAGDSKLTVSWDAVTGASSYRVFVYQNGTVKKYVDSTTTSASVTGLTNGTTYNVLVRALVDGTWSTYTSADMVAGKPFSTAKPTNVRATAGDSSATVTWSALSGATQYRVFVYEGSTIKKYVDSKTTSATVTGLTNGTKYGFLVRALLNGTWTTYTSSDIVYATPVAANKPKNVKATAGDSSATVTWSALSGATQYRVFVYESGAVKKYVDSTTTSATVTGLTNGTKYGFLVRALVNGAWTTYTTSDIVYATPVAANKPANVKAAGGNSSAAVTWKALSGATKYRVFVYLNGSIVKYVDTTACYSSINGLTNGNKYGFLVRAYVNNAWTSYTTSDIVYATTSAVAKPVVSVSSDNGKLNISWTQVPGATQYRVFYYTGSSGATKLLDTTSTGLTYGATNGQKYGFLVRALVNGTWTSYTSADIVYATASA